MKRPFSRLRPIGPYLNSYSQSEGSQTYTFTFKFKGDVSKYSQKKSRFAKFAGSVLEKYDIKPMRYKGGERESPYEGNTYKRLGKTDDPPTDREIKAMIADINKKVVFLATFEFEVEDIQVSEGIN